MAEFTLDYTGAEINERLSKVDDIPTKVSELENDSDYATKSYVEELLGVIENGTY